MNSDLLRNIIESALLAAGRPLSISELRDLFRYRERPELAEIRAAIETLQSDFEHRGVELIEVATGYRIQVRPAMTEWLTKLWEERPPRYSRALLETLALIAYRQPITRGDIEDVRGVAVSSNIMRTLLERGWVKAVGHREVPGRPALYGSTPQFLEYFGLKQLDDLPPLQDIADVDAVIPQLELDMAKEDATSLRVVAGSDLETDAVVESGVDADDDVAVDHQGSLDDDADVDDVAVDHQDSLDDDDDDFDEDVSDYSDDDEESEVENAAVETARSID